MSNDKNQSCQTTNLKTLFINFQNKHNISEIETLVSDFRFIVNQKNVPKKDFYLAKNILSIYFQRVFLEK